MRKISSAAAGLAMLYCSTAAAAAQFAPMAPPVAVASTAEHCAILATVMDGELIRKEGSGAIPLPPPKQSLKPVPSRMQRYLAYLEKLPEGAKNFASYESWVLDEAWLLDRFEELHGSYIVEFVEESGKPRPAYTFTCDWKATGLTFDPDEKQSNQWLVFTPPRISSDGEYAVVDMSYGYTNTHARETTCLLRKAEGVWTFVGCEASLIS